ncbi:diguanylate cyclase response regulator [Acidihalobacter yilgarnensis]|uniref:Diguanylate cyclase response regulator n=1 Tax=Acidihalobacter yilgarnensis TaxID=2819280 RepID=A0A1D8IRL3_9GAMM|nr:response regulator [Acidihalobacter yilgarnensis]AOU99119.1 diguanylate cyclase response regulator [Acidihalobacter yilgarnensis]
MSQAVPLRRPTAGVPDDVALQRPRILIVDDSPTMCLAMSRLLAGDFEVVEANDGDAAWDIISSDASIQVVFTDLMMPAMNGFQLLRLIRESVHPRINQLPVIIITGHTDDERMQRRAMHLGATDFITKPFDSLQLRARARSYAHLDQTTRKLQRATKALELESTIDTLTGLANRQYLMKHGPELLSFAIRHATPISLLRINIDRFNVLEQKKGEGVAEKVMVNIARIIASCVRSEDTVARIGRADFAVLMLGAGVASARATAEKIHQIMRKTGYRSGQTRFRMTVSEGLVAPALTESLRFEEVLKVAESRLQRGMREGGDQLIFEQESDSGPMMLPQEESLTLDEALVLVRAGETAKVGVQLKRLMIRLYPLLVFGNRQLDLGLDDGLSRMRERLKSY